MGEGAFEFVNSNQPAQTGTRQDGDDCAGPLQLSRKVAQIVRTDQASRQRRQALAI